MDFSFANFLTTNCNFKNINNFKLLTKPQLDASHVTSAVSTNNSIHEANKPFKSNNNTKLWLNYRSASSSQFDDDSLEDDAFYSPLTSPILPEPILSTGAKVRTHSVLNKDDNIFVWYDSFNGSVTQKVYYLYTNKDVCLFS